MESFFEDETCEVHLTVDLNDRTPEELAAFADAHGCRFLHVVLDAGAHRSHPMLSWRQHSGLDAALGRAATIGAELEHQGMKSARIKIEARPDPGIVAKYFEAHFKLELAAAQLSELETLAQKLGVHLSRNARSRNADKEQRFLTARCGTLSAAEQQIESIEAALRRGGWRVVSVDREAVLYDSNLELDEGWSN